MNNLTQHLTATTQRLQDSYDAEQRTETAKDKLINAGLICGFCELPLKGSKSETCHCD